MSVSKKAMEHAQESRRAAMKKIEPLFPGTDEQVNIRPQVRNGQVYFLLEIGHHIHVESRDVEDCVRKARQIAGVKSEKKGKKEKSPAEKVTVATGKKPSTAFADYIKLVKQVNEKMSKEIGDAGLTPESVAKAAHKLFTVDVALAYLRKAPNPGVMKMRACNHIASALRDKNRAK
jgi:hypothetical protein